jgi:hypothetical protein
MSLHQLAVAVLRGWFFAASAVAYASAAAGLLGIMESQAAAKYILFGAAAAFIAMILYYGVSDWELRRRLRRLGH